jgi:DNA-binding NarL/FixJ family response regulator
MGDPEARLDSQSGGGHSDRARVLVVDDSDFMLALLSDVVRATQQLRVVGTALCGERAVQLARTLGPDMALIDVRMPGMGGTEAAKQIKTSCLSTLVVLVSTSHPDELPAAAQASADALIWKSELQPMLLDEIWLRRGQPN